MVGVPSALHLAAGLLAVAVSLGLAVAVYDGALASGPSGSAGTSRGTRKRDLLQRIGVLGALVYAVSHGLSGAVIGDPQLWAWLHVAGLSGLAIGAGPTRTGQTAAPLLIPAAPPLPSYLATAAGVVAATRILGAGRQALAAAAGVLVMAAAHATAPTQPVIAEWMTVVGAILLGAWLWVSASTRILPRLLAAFVSALLALAILSAVVLSTVGTAQLTTDELNRLSRLADGLVAEVEEWPGEAVNSASAIAIAPSALLGVQLTPREAADLYQVGFAEQDFFVVLDAGGNRVNGHPQDLGGSLALSLAGDPLVQEVRAGTVPERGGLLSAGGRVVAFGAVALRPDGTLPEDPPAGVLITGRLMDEVWAEREALRIDAGVVGVVAGEAAFASEDVPVDGQDVLDGLDDRSQADLELDPANLFAATAPVVDPDSGTRLGQIITTSTQAVIANVESTQTQRLFVVSVVGGLLAMVVAAIVIRRFVRPITQLTDVARSVGEGDLSSRADIDSPDEVGVLGQTFDDMVASLSAQQQELTSAADTEARLRGRLESLTNSMGDGLIAVDADGLVIQFNPAAETLTGIPAHQAQGLPLAELLVDRLAEDREADTVSGIGGSDELQLDTPTAPTPAAARLVLIRPGNDRVPVAATAAPVRAPDGGEVLGRVFVLRDISRDIEVERMKTEFLSNVSHELRTPITPIKGYANVLTRRDVGPDRTREFAGEILNSTARLERIVGMIVEFAALDSGRVSLEPSPVDLGELVDRTLEEWRGRHRERVFGNHLNGALPPVLSDGVYLRRVLDELIDNAVKFSPEGDPVDITARPEGDRVRLSVVDRGIGIDPKAATNLFTDFKQVDGTETRHYGGLGLGLGLVKRILDSTGASVEVDSDPGIGATFSLLLPIGGPIPVPPLPDPPLPRGAVPPPP